MERLFRGAPSHYGTLFDALLLYPLRFYAVAKACLEKGKRMEEKREKHSLWGFFLFVVCISFVVIVFTPLVRALMVDGAKAIGWTGAAAYMAGGGGSAQGG